MDTRNHTKIKMYPKVKVRQEEDSFSLHNDSPSHVLSATTYCPSVEENQYNSRPSIAKTPETKIPRIMLSSLSGSEGKKLSKQDGQDPKHNVKATTVPRPRAILSSPENDGIFRARNKFITRRASELPNRELPCLSDGDSLKKKSSVQIKVQTFDSKKQSPLAIKKPSKEKDTSSNIKISGAKCFS
ncbi:hypothetical protein RJ641_030142 [Dillenia turbinata]|uniref:Uncharacterized protein n=1 Tax=Dillenia turbinata TaxID=194707 RepID=A0AAN8W2N4_9MAGN